MNCEMHVPFSPCNILYDNIANIKLSTGSTAKILYINARSIKNKIDEFEHIIKGFNIDIDVICVTESWLSDSDEIYFNLKNYEKITANRPTEGAGGVIIFISKSHSYTHLFSMSDNEDSFCAANIKLKNYSFDIMCVYRKPNLIVSKKEKFLSVLMENITRMSLRNSIIVGDFNINILIEDAFVIKYLNLIRMHGYFVINKSIPTRKNANLDHFFVNNPNYNIIAHHSKLDLVDHNVTAIDISAPKPVTKHTSLKLNPKYIYVTDATKLTMKLKEHPIVLYDSMACEEMYNYFVNKLNAYIKNTSKKVKVKQKQTDSCEWLSSELISLIKEKNKWFSKLSKDPNNIYIQRQYKYLRNQVTTQKRQIKADHYRKLFERSLNDNRKTWENINSLLYNKSKKNMNCPLLNNCSRNEKLKKINDLNEFLATVGKKIITKCPTQNIVYPTKLQLESFILGKTTPELIKTIMCGLKPSKAKDVDNVFSSLLKECSTELCKPISILINKSLREGYVPKMMKVARVIPIFKSGDIDDFNNYRPISILPIISKIMEKVVNQQLMEYIERNKLSTSKQYGFRKKSGTSTALIDMVSNLQKNKDNRSNVGALFIDLSKAFDTVDHTILLRKLFALGVRGSSFNWFRSYLLERFQYIKIDDCTSERQPVTMGVPQGSVLGPTLFCLYVQDFANLPLNGHPVLFADDISLLYSTNSPAEIEWQMNSDLKKIETWMNAQKLCVNARKTKYIVCTKSNTPLRIVYQEDVVERVSEFKYLGLWVDSALDWNFHISKLSKKLSSLAGVFGRIRYSVPENLKRTMYFSLFHSHLTYGINIWGTAVHGLLQTLQVVQNKALKNLFGFDWLTNTRRIYKQLQILMVKDEIEINMVTHIHKIVLTEVHTNTQLTTRSNLHQYNVRSRNNIHLDRIYSKKYGSSSILYKSIQYYNKHSDEIKKCNTLKFKLHVKAMLLSKYNV